MTMDKKLEKQALVKILAQLRGASASMLEGAVVGRLAH
jgi:hypothetical protein